jgi:cyclomaltodextrinase
MTRADRNRRDAPPTDWFRDAIIYHLLVDRFAGCAMTTCEEPIHAGGTIRGVIERLDHIVDLGFNAIWISPIFRSVSYHGYDIVDFHAIEPRFGTEDDVRELIRASQSRRLRIILDFVANHCSDRHPLFIEAQRDPSSPYRAWFHFDRRDDSYLTFMGFAHLPKLDLRHDPAAEHIIGAAKRWLGMGFAGLRLDHVIGPPHSFWKRFRDEIKHDFPSAVLIGEAPFQQFPSAKLHGQGLKQKRLRWLLSRTGVFDGNELAARAYLDLLDGCLDFTFLGIVLHELKRTDDIDAATSGARCRLRRHYARFPPNFFLPSFLDSHDCNRVLYELRGKRAMEKLRAAATLQFEMPQPPIVYYGTEVGMSQTEGIGDCPHHGDNLARQPMVWEPHAQDRTLLEFYRDLVMQRRNGAAGAVS